MKKIISLAVCFVMPFVLMGAKTAEDTPPTTSAQAFVLYCPDNNTVICSKNADEKIKPASTTKIMTSLITLEEAASCNSEVTSDYFTSSPFNIQLRAFVIFTFLNVPIQSFDPSSSTIMLPLVLYQRKGIRLCG